MGGTIGVDSEPGKGSSFWFTVAAERGHGTIEDLPVRDGVSVRQAGQQVTGDGERKAAGKVLVVDDNEVNQLVARRMLEQLGYEVVTLGSGEEAIEANEKNGYTAILIDSQMPGMSGNEATRIIRKRERDRRHTPIIALTANAMTEDRERAFAAGVDDYLSKPVFVAELDTTLRRVLSGSVEVTNMSASDLHVGPAASSLPDKILDASIVEELSRIRGSGDADLFSELADQFLQQMPAWLRDLEEAARDGDTYQIRRQAHRLLGLCRQIGAERMAALCVSLEQLNDEAEESDLLDEVSRLQSEFEAAYRALDDRHLGD